MLLKSVYLNVNVYHQVEVDPETRQSRIVQTAIIFGEWAQIIGTMKYPDVQTEECWAYWEEFQQELLRRGVQVVVGKMPERLAQHYEKVYGMRRVGEEGDLVVMERRITQEEPHGKTALAAREVSAC